MSENGAHIYLELHSAILVLTMQMALQIVKERNAQRDAEIRVTESSPGTFEINTPRIHLYPDRSLELKITAEKIPVEIKEGMVLCGVKIDREGVSMVEELLNESKRHALRDVCSCLRANLKYDCMAFEGSRYRGMDDAGMIKLSDLVDRGRGLCTQLSAAMLVFAETAGMHGVLVSKRDFRNGLDHVWAEIRTGEGKWVPVDPSYGYVGDSPKTMQLFKEYHNPDVFVYWSCSS